MMIKRIIAITILIGAALISESQDNTFTSYDLFKLRIVSEVAVSGDGKHVAYVVSEPRPFTDKPGSSYKSLHVLDIATGASKEYISGKKSFHGISWTSDSKKVTMLAKWYGAKRSQVYAIELGSDSAIQVTAALHSIERYEWNPKKNSIAYIATERDTSRKAWIDQGFNAEVYEEDIPHKNLYVFDFDSKKTEKITDNITVYHMHWNPAGDKMAIQASTKNLIDHMYIFTKIHVIDMKTKERTMLVNNPGKLGQMTWSPDGKQLAFIAGVDINDPVNGSLYVTKVPNKKDFTQLDAYSKDFMGSVTHVEWKDSKTLVYCADEGVETGFYTQTVGSDNGTPLVEKGVVIIRNFRINNNVIAFAGERPSHPRELFTLSLTDKKLVKRSNLNPWIREKKLARQEKLTWKSRDGLDIEGVIVYPLNFKEGTKYPMINYIHGGPEACVKNGWTTYYSMWGQVAAAKGYVVLMPNYRGSSGRGVAYSKMDQGDMGEEEFNDVLDGIDHLINKGIVDKAKVGIGGGSYGGFFAAWGATKHSGRFAASCAFVGISDHVSKRFTTDIPYESYYSHWGFWTHQNYELVYDRSPVKYATNNKTATLVLHGKNDPRVHPSQSLELYRALKLHGKGPVRLIWYPGEGHGNRKNPARLDYNLRTLAWFDYYLKSDGPKDKKPPMYLDYGVEIE
ncbi:MAG TPA: S9 family peptidase [Flavobacteriales bacterium]|nr:S9 family peptidase [Flavobacteriales bacterium]